MVVVSTARFRNGKVGYRGFVCECKNYCVWVHEDPAHPRWKSPELMLDPEIPVAKDIILALERIKRGVPWKPESFRTETL